MNNERFGRRITSIRKQKEMTQRYLAAMSGVSAQYLNDIERGRRNPPQNDVLVGMALALDTPLFYLQMLAGKLPSDIDVSRYTPEAVVCALDAFKNELRDWN